MKHYQYLQMILSRPGNCGERIWEDQLWHSEGWQKAVLFCNVKRALLTQLKLAYEDINFKCLSEIHSQSKWCKSTAWQFMKGSPTFSTNWSRHSLPVMSNCITCKMDILMTLMVCPRICSSACIPCSAWETGPFVKVINQISPLSDPFLVLQCQIRCVRSPSQPLAYR